MIVENTNDETFPGVPVVRLDGGLFSRLRRRWKNGSAGRQVPPPTTAIVLDLEGVDFIDSQGASKLKDLHDLTRSDGVTLRLARVKPNVLKVLRADGLVDLIGADDPSRQRRPGDLGAIELGARHCGKVRAPRRVVVDNRAIFDR